MTWPGARNLGYHHQHVAGVIKNNAIQMFIHSVAPLPRRMLAMRRLN
ncbi:MULTISPECIES: hypothetical protein [Photorhabdus]|nr:hypothetical protein [Photorhabdus tasmaniensis]